jgi:hypothetical protein
MMGMAGMAIGIQSGQKIQENYGKHPQIFLKFSRNFFFGVGSDALGSTTKGT